ncbi:MAG: hypothetical protein HY427_00305 [Candidatus Levybacteria bacterium]|nr:hypothetical protein [Candidatus Levybacteria bacterium]
MIGRGTYFCPNCQS